MVNDKWSMVRTSILSEILNTLDRLIKNIILNCNPKLPDDFTQLNITETKIEYAEYDCIKISFAR